jgi:hypothetical protein
MISRYVCFNDRRSLSKQLTPLVTIVPPRETSRKREAVEETLCNSSIRHEDVEDEVVRTFKFSVNKLPSPSR